MGETINLPEAFLERMEELLGTEYEDFLESYRQERYYGLRRNPFRASAAEFERRMPFVLEPVRWAQEGYYYRADDQPGKHILHEAGAYYIQEPSAMAVVGILDPQPTEYILDLCAAPGGKSTQIAGRMEGAGLLVSNELVSDRARILSQNVERMGIRNCVVCNENPEYMAELFPAFFDRVLVDAPCSGEGMFRKDGMAVEEWSVGHVSKCAVRQRAILEAAAKLLRPGGVLVYSTCTFAPDENEGTISRFLQEHEDFSVEEVPHDAAFMKGRPDWICDPAEGIEGTLRLMPHRIKGEGHYIARLRRRGNQERTTASDRRRCSLRQMSGKGENGKRRQDSRKSSVSERVKGFLTDELGLPEDWLEQQGGVIQMFGGQIYLVPDGMLSLEGLKVVRPGLHLGTDKKNRIEPAHALALSLDIEETDRKMALTEDEAKKYLHGESLPCADRKGWTLLTYEGYPLGFGKAANGQMKNHYPKGLRR